MDAMVPPPYGWTQRSNRNAVRNAIDRVYR
jgi:hypothetical protein